MKHIKLAVIADDFYRQGRCTKFSKTETRKCCFVNRNQTLPDCDCVVCLENALIFHISDALKKVHDVLLF